MGSLENVKVLVVDDEDLLREILVEAFELQGAKVDHAESGNKAFEKVKNQNYDLILSDIRMPDGDGISLFANLNKLGKPLPKFFVCSAFNDLNEQKIKELNILKVFSKPFEIDTILTTISDVMQTSKN